MAEELNLAEGRVSVSRERFVFDGVTYPVNAVTHVACRRLPPRRVGPVLLFLIGIPFLCVPSVAALIWWLAQRPQHVVLLAWGAEEKEVYRCREGGQVEEVVAACRQVLEEQARVAAEKPASGHCQIGSRRWRVRLTPVEKVLALVLIIFVWSFGGVYYYVNLKQYQYSDSAYRRDFATNGIEVGTLHRTPLGNPLPAGRYWAVVAVRVGESNGHRILYRGPKGENPERPRFLGGDAALVRYLSPGALNLDLTHWETNEPRSATSPQPIH